MNSISNKISAGKWGVDRREVARQLLHRWEEASQKSPDASFAIYVDSFCEDLEKEIPNFDGVPGEDFFSAILQCIRDQLSGSSFENANKSDNIQAIRKILEHTASSDSLTPDDLDYVYQTFIELR